MEKLLNTSITVHEVDGHRHCTITTKAVTPGQQQEIERDIRKKYKTIETCCQAAMANMVYTLQRNGLDVDEFLSQFVDTVRKNADTAYLQYSIHGIEPEFKMEADSNLN